MERLSENCLAKIISFTTPMDACRFAAISRTWRSAADSEVVWRCFLPNYEEILDRADSKIERSSLKNIFFHLCRSILVGNGCEMLTVNRSSGKISIVMSPMELISSDDEDDTDCVWESLPTSGLNLQGWNELQLGREPPLVFQFKKIYLLNFSCIIKFSSVVEPYMLSEKTYYGVRLVYRIASNSFGLDYPLYACVQLGPARRLKRVSLRTRHFLSQPPMHIDLNGLEMAELRDDGWMQLEICRFFCKGMDKPSWVICFYLMEGNDGPMDGLIFNGLEFYPLN